MSGCRFILYVQEMDLERWQEKLAKDQERGLYPISGMNLSFELKGFVSMWLEFNMITPSRATNCHDRSERYPLP
jgi:hypothetical protein